MGIRQAAGDGETRQDDRLYRAPALEKGLDILELLAVEEKPLTLSAIVQKLGRSTGELFRMIQVLEHRGFVAQGPDNEGYALTTRLFELGLRRPQVRNLVEIAVPILRRLSGQVGQSCHLAMPSRGQIVVVARMESREQIGFSVRVGYRQPMHLTTSGMVLYAFQPEEVRAEWEAMFDPAPGADALADLRRRAHAIRTAGFLKAPSGFIAGITDIAAPVLRGTSAAAALGIPFVKAMGGQMPIAEVARLACIAATEISRDLLDNDARA